MRFLVFVAAALAGAALPALALADQPSPSPSPVPSASASPSPSPAVQLHGVFSATEIFTSGVNATGSFDTPTGADLASRFNVSNAFAILTKNQGTLQYALQAGAYSIPVVGFAGNKTIAGNANTGLYGPVPLAYLEYVPSSNFNVSAGVLATLTGAESTFTYEDWNIQRGAVWNVENAVSRGVRMSFTTGKLSVTGGANDGFYSGSWVAAEGSLNYVPDSNESLLFVALIPNAQTPPNPTASVANKELLNLVYTRTLGKLQIAPYVLWAHSPSAPGLGYTSSESAFGAAVLADMNFSSKWSTALRYETLHNSSMPGATSLNADLVGYGPGSGVNTLTLTPEWKDGPVFARVDFSEAWPGYYTPGLAFGTGGTGNSQFRTALELGIQL
ncbi:MAG TPA: outer membrane beta-barrel protein [Candidatus Eremiobacteraceae bacterium]|nr:outer membrane beta-barrel protein [Candidatus Eremiobacteraceae bacterium]